MHPYWFREFHIHLFFLINSISTLLFRFQTKRYQIESESNIIQQLTASIQSKLDEREPITLREEIRLKQGHLSELEERIEKLEMEVVNGNCRTLLPLIKLFGIPILTQRYLSIQTRRDAIISSNVDSIAIPIINLSKQSYHRSVLNLLRYTNPKWTKSTK